MVRVGHVTKKSPIATQLYVDLYKTSYESECKIQNKFALHCEVQNDCRVRTRIFISTDLCSNPSSFQQYIVMQFVYNTLSFICFAITQCGSLFILSSCLFVCLLLNGLSAGTI